MVRIARLIGFLFSAVVVQLATAPGLLALALSAALAWGRLRVYWILIPAVGGAVAAHALFEGVSTGGKVVNAMSNLPFEFIVYLVICLIGYAVGALARRFR
mgnify:CR=1 FL=1